MNDQLWNLGEALKQAAVYHGTEPWYHEDPRNYWKPTFQALDAQLDWLYEENRRLREILAHRYVLVKIAPPKPEDTEEIEILRKLIEKQNLQPIPLQPDTVSVDIIQEGPCGHRWLLENGENCPVCHLAELEKIAEEHRIIVFSLGGGHCPKDGEEHEWESEACQKCGIYFEVWQKVQPVKKEVTP